MNPDHKTFVAFLSMSNFLLQWRDLVIRFLHREILHSLNGSFIFILIARIFLKNVPIMATLLLGAKDDFPTDHLKIKIKKKK